jgi:protein tyrosine/serine phosphatase
MRRYFGKNTRAVAALLAAGCLLIGAVRTEAARGVAAQEGIVNFGKVNELIYRGAQPDAAGITNLSRLGVKTIINLCATNEVRKHEEPTAQALGITYTNIPLRGVGRPTDAQVRLALHLIATLPGPVFIHCEHGCDRTGTVIACYRIEHDQWGNDRAFTEAKHYGLSPLERGMMQCIQEFKKTPARSP